MKKKPRWNSTVPRLQLAAVKALHISGQALTAPEIVKMIISKNLFSFSSETPIKSLYSVIVRCNMRSEKTGQAPIFRRSVRADGRVVYKVNPLPKSSSSKG